MKRSRMLVGIAVLGAMTLAGCTGTPEAKGESTLTVYATTGYLADAVENIAPEATVTTMVGPGGDPHTHQPSTKDIEAIQSSDLVLWNGLYLEAQMIHQLESLGEKQLAVGEMLPKELLLPWPETDHEGNSLYDPHVWNSPEAWSLVVGYIADKLAEIDPDRADTYRQNAAEYQEKIREADKQAAELLAKVPAPRILVTGHDAFNYFGHTYNLEVFATDFVSTEAALNPEQLSELAAMIAEKKVPVIFLDNQVNPQAITSLKEAVIARGWDVKVADEELYADSLGADPGVDTYLEVFEHNARAVATGLAGGSE